MNAVRFFNNSLLIVYILTLKPEIQTWELWGSFLKALEQEIKAREPRCSELYQVGDNLIASKHYASKDIRQRITSLQDKWQRLKDLVAQRRTRLEDAAESHQVKTIFRQHIRDKDGYFVNYTTH